jgi:hypothetical protein
MKGLHIQPIARQDTFGVAPGGIGGRPPAPGIGSIDNVVVHQGCSVHHLHHRAQAHHAVPVVTERFGRQQQQGRADPLAPAFAQVVGNVGDSPHIGNGVAHQLVLDGAQVVA